jgi:hypothetical protein
LEVFVSIDQLIWLLQQIKASDVPGQLVSADLTMGLEPMTAFTDAILAAWTAFLAARLFARSRGNRAVVLWTWAFVAAVVSSLAGVAYHGCRILFTAKMVELCWKVVPISTGIAALCLGSAGAITWFRRRARLLALVILSVEFVACVIAAVISNSFMVAAIDYVPVLLLLLIGSLRTWGRSASRLVAIGIVISFIAFGVQVSSLRVGGLDHNDIFHMVQAVAMYLLYLGGAGLGESATNAATVGAFVEAKA